MKLQDLLSVCSLIALTFSIHAQGDIVNQEVSISILPADRINTRFLEFAPMYYEGGIIFVHARDQDKFIDKAIGTPYFEIMYSDLGPDGMPLRSYNFSSNIRTKFHEGPASFNADFTKIYFTRSNYSNGQEIAGSDGKAHMKIYSADKGLEDWENISELPYCTDDFDTWGPALAPDGKAMVLVSNRPGGYGSMDLYISRFENGVWSEPVNLGPGVNTSGREAFPFWHPAGVLFFASDGLDAGPGRFDIYAVKISEEGVKSAAEVLPAPVNSKYDDLTFICNQDGTSGFFASSRKTGKGKDDIYSVVCRPGLFAFDTDEMFLASRQFHVVDAVTGEPVAGASLWWLPVDEYGMSREAGSLVRREVNTADGRKKIILEKHNIPPVTVLDPAARADSQGRADIRISTRENALLWVAAPGYFDQKESWKAEQPGSGATEPIEVFLTPEETGEFVATDGNAECITVTTLSLDKSSSQPVDGARVTLRDTCNGITRIFSSDSLGIYTDCLKPDCVYRAVVNADGFAELSFDIIPAGRKAGTTVLLDPLGLEERADKLKTGDVVALRNIYYDFNKSAIRKNDADELESLARIMIRRPEMRIELRSHTDSRGTEQYNMELSERRAVSAFEFLVSRGVEASRIELKPMGESRLINHCTDGVDCTDEEHQQNRRTEFVVLTIDNGQGR